MGRRPTEPQQGAGERAASVGTLTVPDRFAVTAAQRRRSRSRRPSRGASQVALALIVSAQFLIILDSSIVTVALPDIQRSLGFSQVGVQTVVTAYNTAFGGALILGGRVADLLGHRRVFGIGMAAFAITTLLCGLATTPTMLVAARILQGLAAAVIAPTALSMLTTTFADGPARNRAMSAFGVATVLGFTGGLVLSGLLVAILGWRSIFYVVVPVALAASALTPRLPAPAAPRHGRIDTAGALLVTFGMALLVVAPAQGAAAGWTTSRFWLPLVGGAGLLWVFVLVESRVAAPLVRLGFFRLRTLRAANLVTLTAGAMTGAGYLLLTLYLQQVLHYTPLQAGLAVAPTGVANVALGLVSGRLVTRFGVRRVMTGATAAAAAFLALLASVLTTQQRYAVLAVVIVAMGMCFLLTTVSATIGATTGVSNAEQGLAGGLRQTSLQLGIALGVAALVSVAASHTGTLSSGPSAIGQPAALVGGFQLALVVLAGLAVLASAASFFGFRAAQSSHAKT